MSKSVRKKVILLVGIVIVIAVIMVVKGKGKTQGETVVVDEVKNLDIVELVTASGKVNPVIEVKISPDVSGEIVELPVKEGDYVNKGDLLVKIKPDVYESIKLRTEAAVNSSLAQKEQIEAQLAQAKSSFERDKKLFADKAITQKEFEATETSYNALQAQYKAALYNIESSRASLKESEDNLRKTIITAPTSGIISKLNVELGERVVGTGQMAGTEILRLANLDEMEINAEINENDIVRVEVGDTTLVEIDAYPNKKFKGIVTSVANSAKETTSLDQVTNFKVEIFVFPSSYADLVTESNPYPLRPGLSTNIDIITDSKRTLAVPIQSIAVREKDGKREEFVFVYQQDSSIVKMKKIVTGIQDTYNIEISGLNEGDKIVTGPYSTIQQKLAEGMKVTLQNTPQTPAAVAAK